MFSSMIVFSLSSMVAFKSFKFDEVHYFIIFSFGAWAFGVLNTKSLSTPRFTYAFLHLVLVLTYICVVHFEFLHLCLWSILR